MARRTAKAIRLRGVRQNNLKNLDVDIPIGHLVVVTGLSGSGKSSLVFDSLHAEGNRRYAETFSPYTRQFLELMDRPKVDSIENIRPSIAVEQGNTVKTSRSTVGTMTELCDYFKVWFSHLARLHDPLTGEVITRDTPQTMWRKTREAFSGKTVLLAFALDRPGKLEWGTILKSLSGQGYTRVVIEETVHRIDELDAPALGPRDRLFVIQDRIRIEEDSAGRFMESAKSVLHFGEGRLFLHDSGGRRLRAFSEGLHRPGSNERFRDASPNLFSFNSPVGACPECRGFGRIIKIDDRLVIPDHTLSLSEGAIKAFSGAVYSESQRDLLKACRSHKVRTNVSWKSLSEEEKDFVMNGDPKFGKPRTTGKWYGVRRFFKWLEENTYKMHVRVFLSRYRAYVTCPSCNGNRLQAEALCWKWEGRTLPELYRLPVSELAERMRTVSPTGEDTRLEYAHEAIVTRLQYLCEVGLGYLTLDRTSRSLSGGETQRVNLTSCLGTALVDTLFILDEPSIGLHCRDIDRLIGTLRRLTRQGNTVVVVEHDERIMRAADTLIEIGPEPGAGGGRVVYNGRPAGLLRRKASVTGQFLSGRRLIPVPAKRRPIDSRTPRLRLEGVSKHNLNNLNVAIPLRRFVVLSGVSGSGKSTLLHNALYQGLLSRSGKACEDPATIGDLSSDCGFAEVLLVDQSPASRTPRSNPALFSGAWDGIRQLFAQSEAARREGFTASSFSFNSGDGRCPHCQGLGFERVEMQFMADIFVACPVCEGRQFREETLDIKWREHSVAEILALSIDEALALFSDKGPILRKLKPLQEVGLGYLSLGQPLNTLSGGESQRLKLVRYMSSLDGGGKPSLLLLDEPTTGLHLADIERLLKVLHALVDHGHSLVVIEHHPDILRAADWILELGPEAGAKGGRLVYEGLPDDLSAESTATAPYLLREDPPQDGYRAGAPRTNRRVPVKYLTVKGAREHNLKDISARIPREAMTVVTGVSGSGKSTLAFDIIFAEGQRRFMESMSSWARQYVEQLPKPEVDQIHGVSPTIAIEQRVTHGTRKSTVATITEVAQYLRLLYARIGIQHSPVTGEALVTLEADALVAHLRKRLRQESARHGETGMALLAQLVRGRKGHHEPLANWARSHEYQELRIDGEWVPLDRFRKLDRYREHTIELVVATARSRNGRIQISSTRKNGPGSLDEATREALTLGKGSFLLAGRDDPHPVWFSTRRSDPVTGEAYPDLDPKDFSWNAPRGWCPTCHGYGRLYDWMADDERYGSVDGTEEDGDLCPDCGGDRLNRTSRFVYLKSRDGSLYNLPALLSRTPGAVMEILGALDLDKRASSVLDEILPEIRERLRFMDEVGLDYLSLDRPTITLSGGEAQRIRLAAQLGSNLAGALYVLDEPSIGLHERDNQRLLASLDRLKEKGNTLLVVEHDPLTMRRADHIIDLGPGAGKSGGDVLASGSLAGLLRNRKSITGECLRNGLAHPLKGTWRSLPAPYHPRRAASARDWLVLKNASLRNLKGGDLILPKARLIMVCGISGAGKSTLVRDLLMPATREAIRRKTDRLKGSPRKDGFASLRGSLGFRQVIEVDQSPIGKTPRSTPATYIGAFDRIRELFASTPEARIRGYTRSAFSFNTKGGRCETCKGAGRIKLEMSFMPDTYVPCDECHGRRYGKDLNDIQWNGASIADVMEMSFSEAASFFAFDTRLGALLNLMQETGLGYLTLGQSSPTLSGGEAQRLKLVSELARGLPTLKERQHASVQPNLYILEEPTIGLHMSDVERLTRVLHQLVDQGHTVIVIEHNLDLIAEADFVVEVGPEGGEKGGHLLFQGPLEELLTLRESPTAPFLKKIIN